MYLCGATAVVLVQSNLFLFCKYVIGKSDLIVLAVPSVSVTALISIPFWTVVAHKTSKRHVYFMAGPILAASLLAMAIINNETAVLVLALCFGSSFSVVYMVPFAMLPDVVERDARRSGRRREGIFVSLFAVSLKLSTTLAMTISNMLLKEAGYVAPVSTCGGVADVGADSDTDLAAVQPKAVLILLRLLCGIIPASLMLIAMVMAFLSQGRDETMVRDDLQTPKALGRATSEMQEVQDTESDSSISKPADERSNPASSFGGPEAALRTAADVGFICRGNIVSI